MTEDRLKEIEQKNNTLPYEASAMEEEVRQLQQSSNSTEEGKKTISFTFSETGCWVDHPPNTTLNDLEAANGTLMCILLAQHCRRGGVAQAISWRNQCFDAMTEFVSDFIAGKAQAMGFFSSALESGEDRESGEEGVEETE